MDEEESFFDLVTRFQSKRMDDQRCSLAVIENKENRQMLSGGSSGSTLPPSGVHGQQLPNPNGSLSVTVRPIVDSLKT